MTTDPLVRRFNPAGPNYGHSGLDTPLREEERREALFDILIWEDFERQWDEEFAPLREELSSQRGAVSLGGSVPRADSEA